MANTKTAKGLNRNVKGSSGSNKLDTSEIIFKVIAYTFVGIFALMCLYPLVYALSASISAGEAMLEGKVVLFPVGFQIDAFKDVVYNKAFWISYCNTFFVTLYGTVYCMGLSIMGAYALSKKRLYGHKLFNFLLIFTMWFSAGVIPMHLNYQSTRNILSSIGITDQKWLIVIAMGMAAFNIILLRNAFEGVPKEIEEAATVDGANDFQIMSKIYVPMSKATVATVGLFYGISRWNGYFWAMKEVDNAYDLPLQVIIQSKISDMQQQAADNGASLVNGVYSVQSLIYAMIIFAIIPILIIYPFIQKYFAAGVNLGGVKE
jgi:putative aldouronate transport system permease protein